METTINTKQLRGSLPKLVQRVRKGARFMVLYRSRPAFRIVPVHSGLDTTTKPEDDSLYHARAVGRTTDGRSATDHDADIYVR
jgi:antitoxin (DNA-binding transcriptional repressor) of toxin-antitoxin stability system